MQQHILIEYRPKLFSPPRSSIFVAGNLTIIPGVQKYSLEKWTALQNQPRLWEVVQGCIDNGILRIISQSSDEKPETPELPKSPTEAVSLVKKTFVISLLKSWLDTDARPTVKNAILAQLRLAEEDTKKQQQPTNTKSEEE